ncbi:MAG: hypothetical protein AAF720_02715 [Pseudomonadota bacterium]
MLQNDRLENLDDDLGSGTDLGRFNERASEEHLHENRSDGIRLCLDIEDQTVIAALSRHSREDSRQEFASTALKIGILALNQAQGEVDVERVRGESDRLIANLGSALGQYRERLSTDISKALQDYFDPSSGRFTDRVERLVKKDGELETVLRGQLAGDGSVLQQTLSAHMGPQSALMQAIDPGSEKGLARQLASHVNDAADAQREHILKEFSLDNPSGALSRTLKELTDRHGAAGAALEAKISEVVAEFSLDKEDSALSRLVARVDNAQRLINDEFSLDKDGSALARMRKEIKDQVEELAKGNRDFQEEVRAKLQEIVARKEESQRSTRHGGEFEEALCSVLQSFCQSQGDIATATGNKVGVIRNNKKGDCVIELGPDHVSAGAKIVVEAKARQNYSLGEARAEIAEARKNRGAATGLFVFSERLAPAGLEPLLRFGDDVFVIWNENTGSHDAYLKAGLALVRALAAKPADSADVHAADLELMSKEIREIEKQAAALDKISTSAETVRRSGETIRDQVDRMKIKLLRAVAKLDEGMSALA